MELAILMGLQGAGKSTFYQTRLAETHAHISKDLWPNARNREARQRRLIAEALEGGRSVAVDNTNPEPEMRAPLIELGKRHGAQVVGYYFAPRLRDCLARNAAREGRARVPEVAIFATARRLTPPSYEEGFDELFYVKNLGEEGFALFPWREEATH